MNQENTFSSEFSVPVSGFHLPEMFSVAVVECCIEPAGTRDG